MRKSQWNTAALWAVIINRLAQQWAHSQRGFLLAVTWWLKCILKWAFRVEGIKTTNANWVLWSTQFIVGGLRCSVCSSWRRRYPGGRARLIRSRGCFGHRGARFRLWWLNKIRFKSAARSGTASWWRLIISATITSQQRWGFLEISMNFLVSMAIKAHFYKV